MEENVRYDIRVLEVKYLTGYKFWVKLSDNTERIYNMEQDLDGEVYQPLKDINLFKKLRIKHGVVCWPNGADIAPEHLDLVGLPIAI